MKSNRSFHLLAVALATALILLSLPVFIAALAPQAETTWRDFTPPVGGWISSLPVASSITADNADGLTADAAYQYSPSSGGWSGWQTANLSVSSDMTATRRLDVTDLNLPDGINFIQYRITDTIGAISQSPVYPINIDTTAPPAPIAPQPQPDGWTNSDDFSVTWTNPSDPNGVSGVWYKLGDAPTAADDGTFAAGNDINSLTGINVGFDDAHWLWLWLADGLGNADHNNNAVVTLRLDTTAPAGLIDLAIDPAGWNNANHFDLSWAETGEISGLSGVRHQLHIPPANADDGSFSPSGNTGLSGYAIPGNVEGWYELWVWPVDGAGNTADAGEAVSVTLGLDLTPPGPPATVPQVTPSGWQTETAVSFAVTWNNPPDLSGIAAACYKLGSEPAHDTDGTCIARDALTEITGIVPPAPGSYHLFLWLQDAAGNLDRNSRRVTLDAVQWDPVPPEVFVDVNGTLGENDWFVSPIAATIIASDVGSGLARVEYNLDNTGWVEGRQLNIDVQARHILYVRAIDAAGNITEVEPLMLNYDATPPGTALTFSAAPAFGNWFGEAIAIQLDPHDLVSGPAFSEWKLDDGLWMRTNTADVDADGKHVLQYYSADRAGNIEETQVVNVNVDRTPPVTSYVITPGEANENGWYNYPVTVTLVPADDGIGVADTMYRVNDSPWFTGTVIHLIESGEYAIEFYSIDHMGHVETPYSIPGGVRIDTEAPRAPTPISAQPSTWTNENAFQLTFAMPPDLSGIAGAYYKVGDSPADAEDGQWRPGSSNILNVQTPGEGQFYAYVWLKDHADNVDHTHSGIWMGNQSLFYDATPPVTSAELDGAPGTNGWFTSPVRVTLAATDTLSGVAGTSVSIDGGAPVTTPQFTLPSPGKHTVRFSSADAAGNEEDPQLITVRIDPDPPPGPIGATVGPRGWTKINNFTLLWTNPPDISGIAYGYYKIGDPPANAEDGIRVPPIGVSGGITAPAEGTWDMHFWLMDHAGNADIATRTTFRNGLRFDGSPPVTAAEVISGEPAASGWYTDPVIVRLSAQDEASGVHLIRYRVNDGEWSEAETTVEITLDQTGQYTLRYQTVDNAGNMEAMHQMPFKIDLAPPWPHFHPADRYQRSTSFQLSWEGVDEPDGSGLLGFDLQSRDGRNGAWTDWGSPNVPDTSGRYYGNPGHRYFFRIRARDRAGNLSAWRELAWGVYVDRLGDGNFPNGDFGAWQPGGELAYDVITASGPQGDSIFVAQLGSPNYGPNVPGRDIPNDSPGTIPVGPGRIAQTVRIPGRDVLDHPALTFWYRIYTYDTVYSENLQQWFDTLDLKLDGPTDEILALRDGLPIEDWVEGELADLGWRQGFVSVPAAWAGENVTVKIENWNRIDGRLNTWSEIADVRLWEPHRTYLPQIIGSGAGSLAAESTSADPFDIPASKPRPVNTLR